MAKKTKTTEAQPIIRCTFLIDKPTYLRLSALRAERRISMQAMFTEAVEAWLSKQR
jgi:hypothetical protein